VKITLLKPKVGNYVKKSYLSWPNDKTNNPRFQNSKLANSWWRLLK